MRDMARYIVVLMRAVDHGSVGNAGTGDEREVDAGGLDFDADGRVRQYVFEREYVQGRVG